MVRAMPFKTSLEVFRAVLQCYRENDSNRVSYPMTRRSFWKRTDVRIALLALSGVVITAVLAYLKHEPKPEPSTTTQTNTVNNSNPNTNTNTNTTQVTVTIPPTGSPQPQNLVLEQFALNESDSLFENCADAKEDSAFCGTDHKGNLAYWAPSRTYSDVLILSTSGDWILKEVDVDDPPDKHLAKTWHDYRSNKKSYEDRLLPVFDVVVRNPRREPVVLSSIDSVTLKLTPYAQGDGEEGAGARVLPVVHRYEVRLPSDWDVKLPFVRSTSATPPLSIAPNQVGRFQVAIGCEFDNMTIYELRLRFHFGPNMMIQTQRFRLTC
jgi:hypothetical protein